MIKYFEPLNNNPNNEINSGGTSNMVTDEKYKKTITKNMNDRIKENPLPPHKKSILDILNIPYSPVDDFLKKLRKKKKNQKLIKK